MAASTQKQSPFTRTIDDMDIFELMGMKNLPDDQKVLRLSEMEDIVLNDFITHDLPKYLAEEDLKELEGLDKENTDPREVYQKFREKIPNFDELLFERAIAFKKELVKQHLRLALQVRQKRKELVSAGLYPQKDLKVEEKVKELQKLVDEEKRYSQVLNLYEAGKWEEGLALMIQSNR